MKNLKGECVKSNFDRDKKTSKCQKYLYDQTHYETTIVTDWNMVCQNSDQVPLIKSVFFGGTLVAAPAFGYVADRFGRRPTLMGCLLMMFATGLAWSFAQNVVSYAILEFLVSAFQVGVFQTAFILGVELVGTPYRVFCGIFIEYFFVLGESWIVLIAYLTRKWRPLILASTVPVVGFLLYWPWLPESVRWLTAQNRNQEAVSETERLVRWNKGNRGVPRLLRKHGAQTVQHFVKSFVTLPDQETSETNTETLLDMLRETRLLLRFLNVAYSWLVVTMVYYGLSMGASTLIPGDPFLNFFAASLVEIPGYTLSYFTMKWLGRRLSMTVCMSVAGLACLTSGLILQFVPHAPTSIQIIVYLVGKLGITAAFGTVYLYTSELLPTSSRTAALGISSMCGRIGSMTSPYIGNLRSLLPSLPLVIFGVSAFISGLLILLLPETLGKELPANIREALDLALPAPSERPFGPERLAVPIVVIDEASADETVDEDDSDDQILNLDDSDIRPLIPDSQLANS